MEGEWFPGVPESSQQPQQITFVTMSTVDDLSYSPSEGQKTRDAGTLYVLISIRTYLLISFPSSGGSDRSS